MAHYRRYRLDLDDHITEAADIQACDDATAHQLASVGFDDHMILELWCGTRYVGRVAAKG